MRKVPASMVAAFLATLPGGQTGANNKNLAALAAGAGVAPDAGAFAASRVDVPGKYQVRAQELYDSASITTGAGSYTYFSTPVGQGGKTLEDTNMVLAGQLPAQNYFYCTGMSLLLIPTAALATNQVLDLQAAFAAGVIRVEVLSREMYTAAPLGKITAPSFLTGAISIHGAALDAAASSGFLGVTGDKTEFAPFAIAPTQSFGVTINISAVTLTAPVTSFVYLNGYLAQPAS